jgi:predicted metal-dependent enzyme (double-stranded beta helix superfamily)
MRSLLLWLLICPSLSLAAGNPIPFGTQYESLTGEVLLENERVRVQKFVVEPGQSTGRQTHRGDRLLVIIKGGVLTSTATGRATLWHDGRVMWHAAREPADPGSRNAGTTPIELIWVAVKPHPTRLAGTDAASADAHLIYPNIPGEDLFENELIVVQRFQVEPGQWEGVHAHRPNMLYIHIKGGQWAARTYKEPEHAYPDPSPDGEVGWMDTFALSDGHESRNIGTQPIDLIWVTLKQ